MTRPTKPFTLSRRAFMGQTGAAAGALLFGFRVQAKGDRHTQAVEGRPEEILNAFIRVDTDNRIILLMNHSEFGNGAYTSLSMMVAEEMDVALQAIELEEAPTSPEYYSPIFGEYLTAGSVTTGGAYIQMRTAGAQARAVFVAAAAAHWDLPSKSLRTENGEVIAPDGRLINYGALIGVVRDRGIRAPEAVELKDPATFRILGKPQMRHEGRGKVDGSAIFGIDIKLPDMLYGSLARCPVYGGTFKSCDDSAALAIPGVLKSKVISNGVVVLARDYWTAKKGRDALRIEWNEGPNAALSSAGFYADYRELSKQPGMLAEDIGNSLAVLEESDRILEAVYEMPYLAHATMEPMNCTARVSDTECEIWSGTQYQSNDQEIVARLLGLARDKIIIHRPLMGGSFGRRSSRTADFTVEAVEAARGESVPVQVIWSREEDIRSGFYRPLFVHRLRGAVDDSGMPVAWHQCVVGQSIMQNTKHDPTYMVRGMDIYSVDGCLQEPFGVFPYGTSYTIPNHRVETHNPPKVGPYPQEWRAVGHTHTGIAYECFLDELAHEGGQDPLAMRLALTANNSRMNAVLTLLREKSGWDTPLSPGRGRGIAARVYSVSPIAQAVEITVHSDKRFSVDRVVCVVDCGFAVNPLGIEAQVQGGIALGLNAVATGEIVLQDGRVNQSNFHDYPVFRIPQMPKIEVHIMRSEAPPTGVGEQATTPIAPAVANALFAATGERIRQFPLAKHGYRLI